MRVREITWLAISGQLAQLQDFMTSYVNLIKEDVGTDGMLGEMTQTLLCIKSFLLSDINSGIKLNQQDYFHVCP